MKTNQPFDLERFDKARNCKCARFEGSATATSTAAMSLSADCSVRCLHALDSFEPSLSIGDLMYALTKLISSPTRTTLIHHPTDDRLFRSSVMQGNAFVLFNVRGDRHRVAVSGRARGSLEPLRRSPQGAFLLAIAWSTSPLGLLRPRCVAGSSARSSLVRARLLRSAS